MRADRPQATGPGARAAPRPGPHRMVSLRAFGQRMQLAAPEDAALRRAALRALAEEAEPFLTAHPLAAEGVALDLGAGFGAFALPFARACPGWTVWCLEPDPALFALLAANIAASGLCNLRALPVGVAGTAAAADPDRLEAALRAGDAAAVAALCGAAKTGAQRLLDRLIPAARAWTGPTGGAKLPAAALAALAPRLVRLAAPGQEAAILAALAEAPIDHVLGSLAAPVPSRLIHRAGPGLRQAWLPLAPGAAAAAPGAPRLALRRGRDLSGRRPGLDIVVAAEADDAGDLAGVVAGLLDNDLPDLRVRVVAAGAAAERLRTALAAGADPRLSLHAASRPGRGAAWNHGRRLSEAAHIAFAAAGERGAAGVFPGLLELARYSGAEVVQAGGLPAGDPGPAPAAGFGAETVRFLAAEVLMPGPAAIGSRVHRRDFLDNRDIWFPEHLPAAGELVFHLLSLQHAAEIPALTGRPPPAAERPPPGDARAVEALAAFRLVLRRALAEGWRDAAPLIRAFVGMVNRTHPALRPDLRGPFLAAAAELWVWMEKALGPWHFRETDAAAVAAADFPHHAARVREALRGLPDTSAFARLDARAMHAAMLAMPLPAPPPAAPRPAPLPAGIADGAVVILRAAGAGPDGPRFLDGDVPGRRVVLAPSTEPPFTGTRWTLRRGLDGHWLLLNQGFVAHCLAVVAGRVTLAPAGHWRAAAVHWRIEPATAGSGAALMLGPAGNAGGDAAGDAAGDAGAAGGRWLCRRPDGMLALGSRAEALAGAGRWLRV